MKLSTAIFRRVKRDGRNPSTGARTKSLEERKKEVERKRQKMKNESPGD